MLHWWNSPSLRQSQGPPHAAAILTNRRPVTRGLVGLDVSLLNNWGERFALLAGEVCKGLAGKAGELDCKGIEAFAYIRLLADGLQLRSHLSRMTFGTPIGAIHPNQACTSKPFNVSAKVGISGAK